MKDKDLIHVNSLNQYLYCPRRLWYQKFYDTTGDNYYLTDGSLKHEHKGDRGGWTDELYLENEELGIHGKIDIMESRQNTPVERKRGDYYRQNDVIQLTAYCLLLEENTGQKVRSGIIYLHGTDERHRIQITKSHIEKLKEIIQKIKNLDPDNPPPIIDNRNKCKGCSARSYCMPQETGKLGEDGQGNLVKERN